VTDSEAPYPTRFRLLSCCGKDESTVVNYACANPWYTGGNSQFGGPPARTELRSACVPACVPLPWCCFRDPLVREVTKINLLFAFHPWFCGCSCVLSCARSHTAVLGQLEENP